MRSNTWVRRIALAGVLSLLGACGGGGGSGETSNAYPPLNNTTNPPGMRIDVSALGLFPFHIGDTLTYDRRTGGTVQASAVTRVVSGPGAQGGNFTVTETDAVAGGPPEESAYVVGAFGMQLHDPLGASSVAPGVYNLVTVLDEYPTPLFPVSGQRVFEAQGNMGVDIDGDGIGDSFRFVYTQVFMGFQSLVLAHMDFETTARFANSFSLTLRGTTGAESTTMGSEETYFAPGIGLVLRQTGAVTENGTVIEVPYSIELRSATVGGVQYP